MESIVKEYKIVSSNSVSGLEEAVGKFIKEGYQPFGVITLIQSTHVAYPNTFIQPIVLYRYVNMEDYD